MNFSPQAISAGSFDDTRSTLDNFFNDIHIIFRLSGIATELTLIKSVTTNSGGTAVASDFTLRPNGGIYTNSPQSSGATPAVLSGVAYTLSEDALAGYKQTGIACVDTGNNNAPVNHPVTLSLGQAVT